MYIIKCSFKYIYKALLNFKQNIPLWKVLFLNTILLLILVFVQLSSWNLRNKKKDGFFEIICTKRMTKNKRRIGERFRFQNMMVHLWQMVIFFFSCLFLTLLCLAVYTAEINLKETLKIKQTQEIWHGKNV